MKIGNYKINFSKNVLSVSKIPLQPQGAKDGNSGKMLPEAKDIILKIVSAFKDKSRKDIDKWRNAIKLAENPEKPRYNFLHDLYDDLIMDGHFKAQSRIYKYSILNTEFTVIDKTNKKINEEATEFFTKKWFYDFLNLGLKRDFRGYTLVEFKEFNDKRIELDVVPPRNVVPQKKIVVPDLSKEEVISYEDPFFENWLIEIGANQDAPLGMINDIVPNLIWKRNVAQSWAEFCEKFGLPLITSQTNKTKKEDLDKIEYMLKQLGEASTAVFPNGTTVDIKEANRTDAYLTYSKFIHFNREEISVSILGGTMITNDGSSRSQSEVHERNLDDKISKAVKRNLEFLVNDSLIPTLEAQGYSFINENTQFIFNKSHNLDLDKYWTITQGVMQQYEVDQNWLSETFHIPITSKKKIQSTNPMNKITALATFNPGYDHTDLLESYRESYPEASSNQIQKLQDLLAELIYNNKKALGASGQLVAAEATHLMEGLISGWGSFRTEANWNAPDHLMLQQMEQNIFEFANSKTEARLAAMSDLMINREKLQINSFSDFKAEAEKAIGSFNKSYLRTEYNNSVATAQNSANYLRFKSEAKTVTNLVQYQTAGDNKVRAEHQLLDDKVFSLDDKQAMRLWPPNEHNCRCEMIQYLGSKNKVESGSAAVALLGEKFKNSEFNVNRAEINQVFTKKQYYTDKGKLIEDLNTANYKDYNSLKDFKKMTGLKNLKLDQTITPRNISELFRIDGSQNKSDFMGFEDYFKRKLIVKKNVFSYQTSKKYLGKNENRHRLFPLVGQALLNPDEVWMTGLSQGDYKMTYLKFFKGVAFSIETILGSNNLEVQSWKTFNTNQ